MFRSYVNTDGLRILLPAEVFDQIKLKVAKYYPSECGGIFVGRITDDGTACIEQMMMPQEFKSNRIWFLRVADFLNKWLLQIFRNNNGEVIYLGEWHSHPNAPPIPSGTDFHSMLKISTNDNIRIETPILLIVGFNGNEYYECFYLLYNKKLIAYGKQN